jgi:hypothetical protein
MARSKSKQIREQMKRQVRHKLKKKAIKRKVAEIKKAKAK